MEPSGLTDEPPPRWAATLLEVFHSCAPLIASPLVWLTVPALTFSILLPVASKPLAVTLPAKFGASTTEILMAPLSSLSLMLLPFLKLRTLSVLLTVFTFTPSIWASQLFSVSVEMAAILSSTALSWSSVAAWPEVMLKGFQAVLLRPLMVPLSSLLMVSLFAVPVTSNFSSFLRATTTLPPSTLVSVFLPSPATWRVSPSFLLTVLVSSALKVSPLFTVVLVWSILSSTSFNCPSVAACPARSFSPQPVSSVMLLRPLTVLLPAASLMEMPPKVAQPS